MLILCLTLLAEECIFLDAGSITTNGSILSEKSNSNKKNLFLPEEDREKDEGHLVTRFAGAPSGAVDPSRRCPALPGSLIHHASRV